MQHFAVNFTTFWIFIRIITLLIFFQILLSIWQFFNNCNNVTLNRSIEQDNFVICIDNCNKSKLEPNTAFLKNCKIFQKILPLFGYSFGYYLYWYFFRFYCQFDNYFNNCNNVTINQSFDQDNFVICFDNCIRIKLKPTTAS